VSTVCGIASAYAPGPLAHRSARRNQTDIKTGQEDWLMDSMSLVRHAETAIWDCFANMVGGLERRFLSEPTKAGAATPGGTVSYR